MLPKSFVPDGAPGALAVPQSFVPDTPSAPAPQKPALYSGGFKQGLKDFAGEVKNSWSDPKNPIAGVIKGIGSTLFGTAKLGEKVANVTGLNKIPFLHGELPQKKPAALEPQGTGQKIGFGAEQLLEYLIPAALIRKGTKAVEAATAASKLSPLAKTALNIGGKAAIEGASAGAVASAQTGSVKEGAKTGAVVAGLSGGLGTLAAATKPVRQALSEKLYSQIFKNSYDDMAAMLKTGALQDLQKTNPERFQQLAKQGIIKTGADGTVAFNPTLAREALDRGLKGSIKNMSNEVVRKTLDLEEHARTIAATAPETIKVDNSKNYINLLNQVKAQYKGTFFPERGQVATEFANKLKTGELSGEDALRLRRFLDSMRVASSYRPSAHISVGQEDFKAASDQLRGKLNSIPGMKDVMNNYRFYIDALESLAKEAAKRGNSAVINLIDTALFGFGGGLAGPEGAAAFPLARRALTVPSIVTGIGSKLDQTSSGNLGRLIRGAVGSQVPNKQ